MKSVFRVQMPGQRTDSGAQRPRSGRTRCFALGTLAAAVCCMAGNCLPFPGAGQGVPNESARVRVATFNTRCIVPEMDDLTIQTQIINALEKGAVLCDGTLAEIAGDILSVGGLTDTRGESRDRTRERAAAIADLINKQQDDFDIIALNEVFLEDAREIFVDELKSIFPYYIDKLEGSTICTEDSGLMLFSRWPLEELGTVSNQPDGSVFPYYAGWTEFDDCRCEDCLAEKGAGYVRVQNPSTGDAYHVVFTHMQADPEFCPLDDIAAAPPPPPSSVRTSQFEQIRTLLESWIGQTPDFWHGTTNVVVMGDTNIAGTQEQAALAANVEMPDNSEWHEKFNPAQSGGYFAGNLLSPNVASPLYDAWAQTTSPWDPGITCGSKKRFDYIFLNCIPGSGTELPYRRRIVPHHMTILPFNDESDHYGVRAVLNRWQPYCMPVEARTPQAGYTAPDGSWSGGPNEITWGPWPNNQSYDMEITVPGGYQWFRFDQPGTYSFALANIPKLTEQNEVSDFDLRVYTATDLTNDIWNYYGEETDITEYFPPPGAILDVPAVTLIAKKFLIPAAPFYVRISPKDAAGVGKYRLYVHRHEGRTKKDAVLLPTCCTQEYFHGMALLNAEDMPWFQLNLERPDNPAAHQSLRFVVMWQPAGLTGTWVLRLQDENDTVLAESTEIKTSSPAVNENDPAYGEATIWHYVEVSHDSLESLNTAANPRFYLRTSRPGLIINGAFTTPYDRYRLRWETNLTILHGKMWAGTHALRLKCSDETCIDAADSDEAGMRIWADGMLLYDWTHNDIGGNATDMDSGDDVSLEKFVRPDGSLVRYVESCEFRVLEYDPGGPDYGSKKTLNALGPKQNKAWKGSWGDLTVPCSGVGDDGSYEFSYNRSRSMQYPPCD